MKGSSVLCCDPSSGQEGPQTPELAGSKHFTLTPDTRGLVNIGKRGDPENEVDADREQPFFQYNSAEFW